MIRTLSPAILAALACPQCGGALAVSPSGAVCAACQSQFGVSNTGQLDLRLTMPKKVCVECEVGVLPSSAPHLTFEALPENPSPEVDFSGIAPTRHMQHTFRSYIPRSRAKGDLLLNIGSGKDPAPRLVAEAAGYECLDIDIQSPHADLLADAQALPLKDLSVGVAVSVAVLHYIPHPAVMAREVWRVLKPGGKFLGTVAFLEPYTPNASTHFTHIGLLNLLHSAGFEIQAIAPARDWDVLAAQGRMMLFPKAPRMLARILVAPLRWAHRAWWKLGALATRDPRVSEKNRILYGTGAFTFIAARPNR